MFNFNKFEKDIKEKHKIEIGKEIYNINHEIKKVKYKQLLNNHQERLKHFVKTMAEEPILINNEKLSDPRHDPDWKFRSSLRISPKEVSPARNSLDYSARTFRGFNDTSASIF